MTCPAGMLLSYMFLDHGLENRTNTCVVSDKCVDYVTIRYPDSADELKLCGHEPELNTFFADGYSAIEVEFYANREEEDNGFSMDVRCTEPVVGSSRRRRQLEPATDRECVEVSSAERPTVDSSLQLVSICFE